MSEEIGSWCIFQAVIGLHPAWIARATKEQLTKERFRETNKPNTHVFRRWEKAGVFGENSHTHARPHTPTYTEGSTSP